MTTTKSTPRIDLDWSNLLGFDQADRIALADASWSKAGFKPKVGSKTGSKIGQKTGSKIGQKVGIKPRPGLG